MAGEYDRDKRGLRFSKANADADAADWSTVTSDLRNMKELEPPPLSVVKKILNAAQAAPHQYIRQQAAEAFNEQVDRSIQQIDDLDYEAELVHEEVLKLASNKANRLIMHADRTMEVAAALKHLGQKRASTMQKLRLYSASYGPGKQDPPPGILKSVGWLARWSKDPNIKAEAKEALFRTTEQFLLDPPRLEDINVKE